MSQRTGQVAQHEDRINEVEKALLAERSFRHDVESQLDTLQQHGDGSKLREMVDVRASQRTRVRSFRSTIAPPASPHEYVVLRVRAWSLWSV